MPGTSRRRPSARNRFLTLGVVGVMAAAAVPVLGASPAPAATPVSVISHDFEDGTTQGWAGRSTVEVVANSTAQAHGGTHSLLTSGRTSSWRGPTLDLLSTAKTGTAYTFSVWVRMAAGAGTQQLRLSVETRDAAGTPSYSTVVGNTNISESGWTQLTAPWQLAGSASFVTTYIESASALSDFYIDDFSMTYIPTLPVQTDIPSLKTVFASDFDFGAAVDLTHLSDSHATLLTKHHNQLTAGNAMKWDATEPTANTFTYGTADTIANFAKANGMKIYGHTLVWHNQTPAWVFQDASGATLPVDATSKALVLSRLENHIRNVAGHYKGSIVAWDVVNEVIDPGQSEGYRRSNWYNYTGLDYIRTAFRVAREVDPAAQLCINDYSTTDQQKRTYLYNLVALLKGEGVPVDCVGHQMHGNINYPTGADTDTTLTLFEGLGVRQRITEMDISVYTSSSQATYTTIPADILTTQATRYSTLFAQFIKHAANIDSVTTWGIADDNTWLSTFPTTRLEAPLLFDNQLQKKSAFDAIVALKSGTTTTTTTTRPTTTTTTTTTTRPTTTTTTTTTPPTTTTTTTTRPTTTTTTTTRPTTTTTTTTRPTTTTTTRPTTTTTTTTRPTTTTTSTPPTTTTTTTGGSKTCTAAYSVVGQWPSGFQGDVKVTAGSSALTGWTVTWTFANGQTVSQSWSSTLTSSGSSVTASNAAWNGTLGAGATTNFGFIGSWNNSTNTVPVVTCTGR